MRDEALDGLFGGDSIRRSPLFSRMLEYVSGSQRELLSRVRGHKVRASMKAQAQQEIFQSGKGFQMNEYYLMIIGNI